MDNNIDLNLRLISEDCGIFSKAAPDVIISNIDKLQKSYTEDEVVKIYNYMLPKCTEPRHYNVSYTMRRYV